MRLDQPPRLMQPTVAVRDSWLVGERAYCVSANGRTACRTASRRNCSIARPRTSGKSLPNGKGPHLVGSAHHLLLVHLRRALPGRAGHSPQADPGAGGVRPAHRLRRRTPVAPASVSARPSAAGEEEDLAWLDLPGLIEERRERAGDGAGIAAALRKGLGGHED